MPEPQATDPEAGRYLLFGAVVGLLGEVAERYPVLLILDDLHWATQPSLRLLNHVKTMLPSQRLLVVGTHRETMSDPLAALLGDLHREPRVERLALKGLSGDEVLELIETAAGHGSDLDGPAVAEELTEETDGNPFFVTELVRSFTESGARLASAEVPRSVNEVIRGRVVRLGSSAAHVLTTAATIGRDFDPALLARVEKMGEDDVLDVLDAASATALVEERADRSGGYSFVHALIPHALEQALPAARRARLHERIAEALEHEPALPVADLARHWAAVGSEQAHAKALRYVADAGRMALEQLAPDEALDWFQRAIELGATVTVDPGEHRELLIGLGMAQLQAGRPEFRDTLLGAARAARAAGDGDRLVRAGLANNRGYFSSAGVVDEDRVEMLEAALDYAPPDDPCRARLLALLAAELLWSPEHRRRRALSDEAVALAREHGDPAALAQVLTMRVTAVWWPETLAERLDDDGRAAPAHGGGWRPDPALLGRGMAGDHRGPGGRPGRGRPPARFAARDRGAAAATATVLRAGDPARVAGAARRKAGRRRTACGARQGAGGAGRGARRAQPLRRAARPDPLARGPAGGGGRHAHRGRGRGARRLRVHRHGGSGGA